MRTNPKPHQALPNGQCQAQSEICGARDERPESELIVLKIAIVALIACTAAAQAADCPRKDVLGTSRVMTVDPAAYPRVGLQSFPQSLPLGDREVVLTFDDGPNPPTTSKILDALARECVHATFFLIGQSAAAHPALVRRIAAEGHTIGHHTWSHANLGEISQAAAVEQIERGIAADETALQGKPSNSVPTTPFFRFPYFSSTPALLEDLQKRNVAVFGADFWASDWNKMTPQQELKLITDRLQAAHRGIILFHDTKAQTAAMMPDFLRYLRDNNYRVVHVVAASVDRTAARKPAP